MLFIYLAILATVATAVPIIHNETVFQAPVTNGRLLWSCDFENGQCGMSMDKNLWTRLSGEHSRGSTGTQYGGVDKKNGYYMYYDSSRTTSGTTVAFTSPYFTPRSSTICIKLFVTSYTKASAQQSTRLLIAPMIEGSYSFSGGLIQGNKGPRWYLYNRGYRVTPNQRYRLMLHVLQGSSAQADIAIDNIYVYDNTNCYN